MEVVSCVAVYAVCCTGVVTMLAFPVCGYDEFSPFMLSQAINIIIYGSY